ncbi:MAG: zinc metallopeptidase, partial [Anaerolineales bacterium]|nr:zinc metallopeptidase [Anaerolineales bacterium]
MFYLDPMYLAFMIPAFLLVMISRMWVTSTYRKWGRMRNSLGMSGEAAAQRLLTQASLNGVTVAAAQGTLSDHYDPR